MSVEKNTPLAKKIVEQVVAKQKLRTSSDGERKKSMHLNIPARRGMNIADMYSNSDALDSIPADLRERYVDGSQDQS